MSKRLPLVAAQTGISGSTRIGKRVMIGGQVGFAGHTTVGDGAMVAAQSGVHTDIPAGEQFFGYPAQPVAKARRAYANVQRIPYLQKRLKELEGENTRLKRLLANAMLENEVIKEALQKKW